MLAVNKLSSMITMAPNKLNKLLQKKINRIVIEINLILMNPGLL